MNFGDFKAEVARLEQQNPPPRGSRYSYGLDANGNVAQMELCGPNSQSPTGRLCVPVEGVAR